MTKHQNICIVIGTRPEIIKMSPLIRALKKQQLPYYILHTGQHYSYNMDRQFFLDLELDEPKYNLEVGGFSYRHQIALMIKKMKEIFVKEHTKIVFLQGDTNSVLAGALAGSKCNVLVGHHEAGLRSHDLSMMEEINRIITDQVSDMLFAPTEDALKNLHSEGIPENKVFYTGNTIVDAVHQNLKISMEKVNILKKLNLKKKEFILATAHRAENVDNKERLKGILDGLDKVTKKTKLQILFSLHPRTAKMIKHLNLTCPDNVTFFQPLGFLEFLQLESYAKLIITDSGGLQEEACILKVPCITIRDNTERPETIKGGMNILAGADPEKILNYSLEILKKQIKWNNPFGDGKAGEKIVTFYQKSQNLIS